LKPILSDRLRTRTRAQWIEGLTSAGVPCGSVRDLHEVFNDPQIAAREMIASAQHATIGPISLLGVPIKLSDTPASVRTAPPILGQHTAAVLQDDLGLSAQELAMLQARGVV
jgi:crotonobetainyl-CoA:carnitine CoA-transferase CaiB-like acyl-CoA transferase